MPLTETMALQFFRNMGPITADKIRERFSDCFNEFDPKVTSQANLKIVNYLDVTFSLSTGRQLPVFINAMSNHPPSIIKHLPQAKEHRISGLSCDNTEFEKATPLYNEALRASGFKSSIEYTNVDGNTTQQNNEKRKRLWQAIPDKSVSSFNSLLQKCKSIVEIDKLMVEKSNRMSRKYKSYGEKVIIWRESNHMARYPTICLVSGRL